MHQTTSKLDQIFQSLFHTEYEYLQGWIYYKVPELQAQHVIYLHVKIASLYQDCQFVPIACH